MSVFKHVQLSPDTHQKLLDIGKKGEAFDKIITRLVDEHGTKRSRKLEVTH